MPQAVALTLSKEACLRFKGACEFEERMCLRCIDKWIVFISVRNKPSTSKVSVNGGAGLSDLRSAWIGVLCAIDFWFVLWV